MWPCILTKRRNPSARKGTTHVRLLRNRHEHFPDVLCHPLGRVGGHEPRGTGILKTGDRSREHIRRHEPVIGSGFETSFGEDPSIIDQLDKRSAKPTDKLTAL